MRPSQSQSPRAVEFKMATGCKFLSLNGIVILQSGRHLCFERGQKNDIAGQKTISRGQKNDIAGTYRFYVHRVTFIALIKAQVCDKQLYQHSWKIGKTRNCVKTLRPAGRPCFHTIFSFFPISTRVDLTVYQHGKMFLYFLNIVQK